MTYKSLIKINSLALGILLLSTHWIGTQAQSLDAVFQTVVENNMELKAAREQVNSGKLQAKTGIAPNNPEVEFGFYPGNSDAIGNKQVIGISQSIDFPTTYSYKNKIAEQTGFIMDESYRLLMQDILLSSWETYVQSVYNNQYLNILNNRSEKAKQMLSNYQKKQDNGDATQLEVNKAKLFLINIQNKARIVEGNIEQNNEKLRQLNGGSNFYVSDDAFTNTPIKTWAELKVTIDTSHPSLKQIAFQNNSAKYQHKLNKANGLPQLMLGYEREQILNAVYGGVKAGVTIPLWQNKNQVKYAKANLDFLETEQQNITLKIETDYHQRYIKTDVLYNNMLILKTNLEEMNNEYLLGRSLELGQISIIEYFWEMDYFYLIEDNFLALELSYQMSLARLHQFTL